MSSAPQPPPAPSGAGSTAGAGRTVDEGKGRIFPCPSCGADLEFAIDVQSLACPYCGHVERIEEPDEDADPAEHDLIEALERLSCRRRERAAEAAEGEPLQEVACESCGASVRFAGTLTSTICAYCGSPIQRAGVHDAPDRIPVDAVLPFAVPEDRAKDALAGWLAGRWFLPNDLKRRGVDERFAGVYVPYWTFDALTVNRYRGERGEHYYVTVQRGERTVQERRTRWYPVSGSFRRFFDDVLVVACGGLPRRLLMRLEPWPLERCRPYRPDYLAGHFARTWDVPLNRGFAEARRRMEEAIAAEVRRRIGGDTQIVHWVGTRYSALSYKHLLLPVWLLAYRYRDKTYRIAVNATTGEVQGERPWSWVKIALAVFAAAAASAAAWFVWGR